MSTHLVFDMNNLAYRAFYGIARLSFDGTPTGVLFSVLGQILQMQGRFGTNSCVFAFDSKKSKRRQQEKTYKKKRVERTTEELEALWELYQQINRLRTIHLPDIGFQNIFRQTGYEADDIVASVCQNLAPNDRAIVISTDADLYQLINKRVSVYNPKTQYLWNLKQFRKIYGLRNPADWAIVKAIAGCGSDEVKGIVGVGEKTAIKFLNFTLPHTNKTYLKITSKEGIAIRKRNLPLVKLPYEGTKVFKLRKDGELNWRPTLDILGIKTLNPELQYRGSLE